MADCDFSESTFGFALTHELVNRYEAYQPPRFLSLREEVELGYDVSIPRRGSPFSPLFLQFKVPEALNPRHRSSKLFQFQEGLSFSNPSYKAKLYTKPPKGHVDSQHSRLIELEQVSNHVYYACPEFHTNEKFSSYFEESAIIDHTAFFKPSNIGHLDQETHHIYYDHANNYGYVFSKPKEINKLEFTKIQDQMNYIYTWDFESLERLEHIR